MSSTARVVQTALRTPPLPVASTSSGLSTFRPAQPAPARVLRALDISPTFGSKPARPALRRHPPLNPRFARRSSFAIERSKGTKDDAEVVGEPISETAEDLDRAEAEAIETISASAASTSGSKKQWFYPSRTAIVGRVNEIVAPLSLPEDLAVRACTHKSVTQKHPDNHNEKLSFIGRRQLELHLAEFYFANRHLLQPHEATLSFNVLDKTLKLEGALDQTGRVWEISRAMRWKAIKDEQGNITGLSTVRTQAIQALCGAVSHHCGLADSRAFFMSKIVPHLSIPETLRRIANEQQ